MFCKNCGNELEEGALFCSKCGTHKDSTDKYLYCERCGTKITEDAAFCIGCGTPIPEEILENRKKQVEEDTAAKIIWIIAIFIIICIIFVLPLFNQ